jgi:hypothetical protein
MNGSSPLSYPRMIRGALVGLDPFNPLASVIVFQYNPEAMTRRLEARTAGAGEALGGDRSEALRLSGPPRETITVKVEIDATDQLERDDPIAARTGLYPALSALEMLLYPKSSTIVANLALARLGTIEVVPPEAPLTIFAWGIKRVLPVRLTGFSITEDAFDPMLNPIRATADLSLDVLTYADLEPDNPGATIFLAHQIAKEVLATTNVVGAAGSLVGGIGLP